MRGFTCLSLIALLICGAVAQKHALPVVPVTKKSGPTTPPKAVDESDRKKECPAGFTFVGKQCAKTLNAQPEVVCPQGTTYVDNKCAKYVGKISECPSGYTQSKGACTKNLYAQSEVVCPAGFNLTGKDTCSTKIANPDKNVCPAGSLAKGDQCVRSQQEIPEYVCPSGYQLSGKKCQRDETFDCTPARVQPEPKKVEEPKKGSLRHDIGKGKTNTYTLPAHPTTVEEYVIQKTCKRIVTEAARPICAKGGVFDGKLCNRDVNVPSITKPGGYRDQSVPASRVCPDGYAQSNGKKGECTATEDVLPEIFCPNGTINVGDRCATYQKPRTVCPEGFYLDDKTCTKTIFAAPIVEYTVTYSCVGKDCGHHGKH